LDFCHKYHFAAEQQASLPTFVERLHSKQQSEFLCEQARQAVLLYYELDLKATLSQAEYTEPNHREFHADVAQPQAKYAELKQAGASWVEVYEDLNAEIKLRHYSPKTLKAYRTWMRKFQAFIKSKESRLLTQQDVKDFLTHLAVEKKMPLQRKTKHLMHYCFYLSMYSNKNLGRFRMCQERSAASIFLWCYLVKR